MREHLPDDRESVTHHFTILHLVGEELRRLPGYVVLGFYEKRSCKCVPPKSPCEWCDWPSDTPEPTRIGEVFVKLGKAGDESAAVDQWAIAVSIALQHGADGEALFRKFLGARYEPAGRVEWSEGSEQPVELAKCTSPTDYVARWVLARFYSETK